MGMRYERHSAAVIRSARWKGVRYQVKRRDGWACVQCAARHRLEVDHIRPVRTHPELAFDLANLQTLCGSCHARQARIEVGHPELSPERQRWRDLLNETTRKGAENA